MALVHEDSGSSHQVSGFLAAYSVRALFLAVWRIVKEKSTSRRLCPFLRLEFPANAFFARPQVKAVVAWSQRAKNSRSTAATVSNAWARNRLLAKPGPCGLLGRRRFIDAT